MSNPITVVNIVSDDETTPLQLQSKKQRTHFNSNPATVFIIDDEPPSLVSQTPSVVPDTPMSESYVPMVKCNNTVSDPQKPSGMFFDLFLFES